LLLQFNNAIGGPINVHAGIVNMENGEELIHRVITACFPNVRAQEEYALSCISDPVRFTEEWNWFLEMYRSARSRLTPSMALQALHATYVNRNHDHEPVVARKRQGTVFPEAYKDGPYLEIHCQVCGPFRYQAKNYRERVSTCPNCDDGQVIVLEVSRKIEARFRAERQRAIV
jgi:hypothetical protein